MCSSDLLKRFPSVTRQFFIECAGNRARASHKTVQQSHGLTSNTEWTGVPLSVLLKEVGVQSGGSWIVAEGAEEIKGASSIPMGKALDDCLVAYGQMGEPLRPHNGFPLRLMVPGYEGIFQVKYLRRIKVVDRYYWTYNDYGHLRSEAREAALSTIWGPKSIITAPSGEQKLPGPGMYEIRGLAWSGQGAIKTVEVSTDGGKTWKPAQLKGTAHKMAHVAFGIQWNWDGKECEITSRCTDDQGSIQPTLAQVAAYWKEPAGKEARVKGLDNSIFSWKVASDGMVTNGRA